MPPADAARAAAARQAARRLARVAREANQLAAQLACDADVVATLAVPQGTSGDDVALAAAEAAQTSAVTVVVLRNTNPTAP